MLTGMVVSTDHQKRDLEERFDNLPPIRTIPVGFVQNHTKNFERRKKNRLISVARYSPEKQLLHQLEVVQRLKNEFPDIELHLYGFGFKIGQQMKQFIQQHGLEKNVFLRGFMPNLTDEYDKASLALMTSLEEGFSLSTLEAESHGVPVIGYKICYGPDEIIEDSINGYLVEPNNIEQLYTKVREYLLDTNIQHQFMVNAYESVERYEEKNIARSWKRLVEDVLAH